MEMVSLSAHYFSLSFVDIIFLVENKCFHSSITLLSFSLQTPCETRDLIQHCFRFCFFIFASGQLYVEVSLTIFNTLYFKYVICTNFGYY